MQSLWQTIKSQKKRDTKSIKCPGNGKLIELEKSEGNRKKNYTKTPEKNAIVNVWS